MSQIMFAVWPAVDTHASKESVQWLLAQIWLSLHCPYLKACLSICLHSLQGVDGTRGTMLPHHLAGCAPLWIQQEQSQAGSKYNHEQVFRLCHKSGVILSLQYFSGVSVIASLVIVNVC